MLTEYIRAAMKTAVYEILPDDSTFYGEIPGFRGVWANANTLEGCREELEEVMEEWILLSISRNLPLHWWISGTRREASCRDRAVVDPLTG